MDKATLQNAVSAVSEHLNSLTTKMSELTDEMERERHIVKDKIDALRIEIENAKQSLNELNSELEREEEETEEELEKLTEEAKSKEDN